MAVRTFACAIVVYVCVADSHGGGHHGDQGHLLAEVSEDGKIMMRKEQRQDLEAHDIQLHSQEWKLEETEDDHNTDARNAWALEEQDAAIFSHRRRRTKTDCVWLPWGQYSTCSKTCGTGEQSRTRSKISESGGGDPCTGPAEATRICNTEPCPVDCSWGPFGVWGQCSKTCGTGEQSRTREVQTHAAHGGTACTGPAEATRICNTEPCPVDCSWEPFGPWGQCSKTCGEGEESRTRVVKTQAANGGTACAGSAEETRTCNPDPCPIDCSWEPYGPWGECSKTCGGGEQTRTRAFATAAAHGGAACTGEAEETKECNEQACPIDCKFTDWSEWGECSKTCRSSMLFGSRKQRTREIETEAAHGGAECVGSTNQGSSCPVPYCSRRRRMSFR